MILDSNFTRTSSKISEKVTNGLINSGILFMQKHIKIYPTISEINGLSRSCPISTTSAGLASHIIKSDASSTWYKATSAKIVSLPQFLPLKTLLKTQQIFSQTSCNMSWQAPMAMTRSVTHLKERSPLDCLSYLPTSTIATTPFRGTLNSIGTIGTL